MALMWCLFAIRSPCYFAELQSRGWAPPVPPRDQRRARGVEPAPFRSPAMAEPPARTSDPLGLVLGMDSADSPLPGTRRRYC